jgi:hypothetical protein
VTGCTTSGRVRGSLVGGFAYDSRMLVPHALRDYPFGLPIDAHGHETLFPDSDELRLAFPNHRRHGIVK